MKLKLCAIQVSPALAFLAALTSCYTSILAEPPQQYLADDNTLLLYHLNEGTGTTAADSSGSNRHAVYGSGLGIGAPGVSSAGVSYFEKAIQPSAGLTKRVTWTDSGAGTNSFLYPKPNTSFTIEGWFKLTQTNFTNAPILAAVQPPGSPTYDYLLTLRPSAAGKPDLVFRDMGHFRVYTNGTLTWDTNTWYHIAVVVQQNASSASYKIYRTPAGTATPILVASVASGGLLVPSITLGGDRVLSIGNFHGNNGNDYFRGNVDEFRFSNVARSPNDFKLTLGPSVHERIRSEALASNSETDHPMPLLATWNTGERGYLYTTDATGDDDGFSPVWQVQMIDAGAHILPSITQPMPYWRSDASLAGNRVWYASMNRYYNACLPLLASRGLPITLIGSQWEHVFYSGEANYLNRTPYAENPNVITPGTLAPVAKVSPFGPVERWSEIGQTWATSPLMATIQNLYPNPPRVFFTSNNEAPKLKTHELTTDQHYMDLGLQNPDENTKRTVTGQAWIARYRALQQAWRTNLSTSWGNVSSFNAYGGLGPGYFGRFTGWAGGSLLIPGRVTPYPLMWDGGLLDNYLTADYTANTDFQVWSPQVEVMNVEFIRKEALQLNPDYWVETINWNGGDFAPPNPNDPTSAGKLCKPFMNAPVTYSPARYAGMVQFNMWVLRPRVVRDNRASTAKRADCQAYFDALSTVVERIYDNPTLQSFWRNSNLVPNTGRLHPYQTQIPAEYQSAARMFMLEVNLNPTTLRVSGDTPSDPTNPNKSTEIPVFCIARVKGQAPNRQWLLYAFAPKTTVGQQLSAVVTIPGYMNVTVNANMNGALWLVNETTGSVTQVP